MFANETDTSLKHAGVKISQKSLGTLSSGVGERERTERERGRTER